MCVIAVSGLKPGWVIFCLEIITYLSDLVLSVQLGYFDCFSASICLIVYWTMKLASLMYGCLGILAKLKSAFLAMTNVTKWSVSL